MRQRHCKKCDQWSEVIRGAYWECQHCGFEPEIRVSDIHVIPDIKPYISMIDGSVINSRSQHRAHLKQHNCIEVGNDSSVMNPKRKPPEPPPGLKETLIRVANEKLRDR